MVLLQADRELVHTWTIYKRTSSDVNVQFYSSCWNWAVQILPYVHPLNLKCGWNADDVARILHSESTRIHASENPISFYITGVFGTSLFALWTHRATFWLFQTQDSLLWLNYVALAFGCGRSKSYMYMYINVRGSIWLVLVSHMIVGFTLCFDGDAICTRVVWY